MQLLQWTSFLSKIHLQVGNEYMYKLSQILVKHFFFFFVAGHYKISATHVSVMKNLANYVWPLSYIYLEDMEKGQG